MIRREAAFVALAALLDGLKAAGKAKTFSRRVQTLDKTEAQAMPALYLGPGPQQVAQSTNLPPTRTLGALVYVYAANPDKATPASTILNGLLDEIEAALKPSPATGRQTLGDTVAHAWVEGTIEIYEGVLGERAAAIVPVQILLP